MVFFFSIWKTVGFFILVLNEINHNFSIKINGIVFPSSFVANGTVWGEWISHSEG